MLRDVLKLINESNVLSKSALADSLNISIEMVTSLIDQLIQMGYMKEDINPPSCGGNCMGCNIKNCNSNPLNTFTITDKGYRLLNR